ncbi:hypothetical protein GCE9029_00936 [Grimontia celer]|uniref:Uncharacterized protein n=1 Tax=Grimontia celer TaxID=1796497 RepID=A0A128EX38_9GAMM|nr:hypothetical protein GCE9029_00936 [Grimontia celer]
MVITIWIVNEILNEDDGKNHKFLIWIISRNIATLISQLNNKFSNWLDNKEKW